MLALLRAAHPEPAGAVTIVSGVLALAVGHQPTSAALVTATVAASQLAIGWSNDALDARRDAAVGRVDKPVVTGAVTRRTVAMAAAMAAVATVLLALRFGALPAAIATLGLVSALAYNWPLKLTALSPLPYAVSFAALPTFVVLAVPPAHLSDPPGSPPVWLVAAGGLLGAGAHFANVLPDLADDAATGVRGLPHRLGENGAALTAAVFLLAATVVLVTGPPGPPSWVGLAALAAAAVVLGAGWYGDRVAAGGGRRTGYRFRAFMAVALINVGLLLASGSLL